MTSYLGHVMLAQLTTGYVKPGPRAQVVSARKTRKVNSLLFPLHTPLFRSRSQSPGHTPGEGNLAVLLGGSSVTDVQGQLKMTAVTDNQGDCSEAPPTHWVSGNLYTVKLYW